MTMYDQSAQSQLKEKLEYELWLLDFLYKTQETFKGGANITEYTVINRQPGASRKVKVADSSNSLTLRKVKDAMSPLTFIASYKVLDMIIEWILEENYNAQKITDKKSPSQWQFSKKIDKIHNLQLEYPPLIQVEPYIWDYLFALYSNLLKFRHEIVHKNNVDLVKDGKLRVDTLEDGQPYSLELDRGELGFFVRTVVALAELLTGIRLFGKMVNSLLKYHLDRIKKLHELDEFKQKEPILVNIRLEVPKEEGIFPAYVKDALEEVNVGPNTTLLFNLKVIGLVDDKPSECWFFPVDDVPKDDVLELRPDSYPEHKIAPN